MTSLEQFFFLIKLTFVVLDKMQEKLRGMNNRRSYNCSQELIDMDFGSHTVVHLPDEDAER